MFRLVSRFSVSDSQDYLSMNRVKGSQFRDVVPSPRSSDPSQGSPCLDVTKFCFLRQLGDCPTFVLASLISPRLVTDFLDTAVFAEELPPFSFLCLPHPLLYWPGPFWTQDVGCSWCLLSSPLLCRRAAGPGISLVLIHSFLFCNIVTGGARVNLGARGISFIGTTCHSFFLVSSDFISRYHLITDGSPNSINGPT